MSDITSVPGIVGPSNLIAQYAAQDFEGLPDGVPPHFSSSQQSGDVRVGFASIGVELPEIPNDGEETFDPYPVGVIEQVNQSVSNGSVRIATGFLYPSS